MARIRTIKPEFPQSESMGRVSREARLCFILLWTLSDDSGRLRGSSRMLASLLFPYDDDAPALMPGWLAELDREDCVRMYQTGGSTYIEVANWLSHQKIDKPSPSKFPPFDESSRILANPREGSSEDQGPRTKDQGPGTKEGSAALAVASDPPLKPASGVKGSSGVKAASGPAKPDDVEQQVWDDWLALRKAKKAPVTETVLQRAKDEAAKAGLSLDGFLIVWCARGSQGLEASWLKPGEGNGKRAVDSEPAWRRQERERYEQFTGKKPAEPKVINMGEVFDVTAVKLG